MFDLISVLCGHGPSKKYSNTNRGQCKFREFLSYIVLHLLTSRNKFISNAFFIQNTIMLYIHIYIYIYISCSLSVIFGRLKFFYMTYNCMFCLFCIDCIQKILNAAFTLYIIGDNTINLHKKWIFPIEGANIFPKGTVFRNFFEQNYKKQTANHICIRKQYNCTAKGENKISSFD